MQSDALFDILISTMIFTASTTTGLGQGKILGTPTINLSLSDIPEKLRKGIYACRVTINGEVFPAAMHYGPRPALNADTACEVHIIDQDVPLKPATVTVTTISYLRPVKDFGTKEDLKEQIQDDISSARAILGIP